MESTFDVFISYAHVDRTFVRPIEEALRAHGLRVWCDEREIADFASIQKAIEAGLAGAKALLAYYSLAYPRRRACQWELTAAFLAGHAEGDPQRRVLVINPERAATHIEPLALREARFRVAPPHDDPASLRELAVAVAAKVATIERPFGAVRSLASPAWHRGRGLGSNRFAGRTRELWQLHSALHADETPVITGQTSPALAQVRGLGGIGKSLLVEEYALRFGAAYPGGVFWLSGPAPTGEDAPPGGDPRDEIAIEAARQDQVRSLAVSFGLPTEGLKADEIEAAFARALKQAGLRFLWIVDDLPGALPEPARRRWLAPVPGLGKTAITTRDRSHGAVGEIVDLHVLDPESAYELLTARRKPVGREEEIAAHFCCRSCTIWEGNCQTVTSATSWPPCFAASSCSLNPGATSFGLRRCWRPTCCPPAWSTPCCAGWDTTSPMPARELPTRPFNIRWRFAK